jgi:hypothetical protein
MKYILLCIFLVIAKESFAFEINDVVGEWAVYSEPTNSEPSFFHLMINANHSGKLGYKLNGIGYVEYVFDSKSVVQRDGFIEINLDQNNPHLRKAVLSAWKRDKKNYGRLNGLIFMYKADNMELFNTLYMPLMLVNKNNDLHSKVMSQVQLLKSHSPPASD